MVKEIIIATTAIMMIEARIFFPIVNPIFKRLF